jgi:hypothetical protein
MLDLGGAPSASNSSAASTKSLNLNKNCKIQAVVFDFPLLTKSLQDISTIDNSSMEKQHSSTSKITATTTTIQPDTAKIQQVASLLRIDLSGKDNKKTTNLGFDDDLSLILTSTNETSKATTTKSETKSHDSATSSVENSNKTDIRAKYAAKLQSQGLNIVDVDRAKHTVEAIKGDAAGHFAARQHATTTIHPDKNNSSNSVQRWMMGTGTGRLLNYLYQRSMKIAIVGTPIQQTESDSPASDAALLEAASMRDMAQQMKDKVELDILLPQDGNYTAAKFVQQVLTLFRNQDATLSPDRVVWVSDRDDCLRWAKEAGITTLRVLPKNARRGNITAHYTITNVPEAQTILNEINGISYSHVLQQGA